MHRLCGITRWASKSNPRPFGETISDDNPPWATSDCRRRDLSRLAITRRGVGRTDLPECAHAMRERVVAGDFRHRDRQRPRRATLGEVGRPGHAWKTG